MIAKEEADRIIKIKGNTKGSEFQTLAMYIQRKEGKEKLALLEKKLEELGYPFRFDEVRPMEWYPESLSVLAILVAKDFFGWSEKDIFEFGNASPKFSLGVKLFMKFSSPRRIFNEIPEYWRKFMDFGSLEGQELNEKEKYCILRLKDYKFHPDMCHYYAGFFLRVAQYIIKSQKMTVEETKCAFKGDPYDEYLIRWK